MASKSSLEGVGEFAYHFTSIITFWNHAEMVGRQIAQLLLGESTISYAVTAELGNRTLMHAIEVGSHDRGEFGDHLRHFSSGYTIILGYRNFYVHGLYGIAHNKLVPGAYEGTLFTQDGKGRARLFNRKLDIAELQSTAQSIHQLIGYGAAIQLELGATGNGILRLVESYGASLEKPHWPQPVEKTPLYLQGQEPPPPKPSRKRGSREKKPQA